MRRWKYNNHNDHRNTQNNLLAHWPRLLLRPAYRQTDGATPMKPTSPPRRRPPTNSDTRHTARATFGPQPPHPRHLRTKTGQSITNASSSKRYAYALDRKNHVHRHTRTTSTNMTAKPNLRTCAHRCNQLHPTRKTPNSWSKSVHHPPPPPEPTKTANGDHTLRCRYRLGHRSIL